jgi:hypothetical protein
VHNIDAFVQGSDNHLYRRYQTFAKEWRWEDLSAPQNASVASIPSALTYEETGLQRIYTFVAGSDYQLHVCYWNGSKWQWAAQGQP